LAVGRFRPTAGKNSEKVDIIICGKSWTVAVVLSSELRISLVPCDRFPKIISRSRSLQPWSSPALRPAGRPFSGGGLVLFVNRQFIPAIYRNGDTLSRENVDKSMSVYIFLVAPENPDFVAFYRERDIIFEIGQNVQKIGAWPDMSGRCGVVGFPLEFSASGPRLLDAGGVSGLVGPRFPRSFGLDDVGVQNRILARFPVRRVWRGGSDCPVLLGEARFQPEKHRSPRRRPSPENEGGEARRPMLLASIGIRRADLYCACFFRSLRGWLHLICKSSRGIALYVEAVRCGAIGTLQLYSTERPSCR
jgi:hypothetical protein